MINALSIRNFAFIDNLVLEFCEGLTVFSGETGAGKSIVLDALNFALGCKLPIKMFKDPSQPIVVSLEIDRANIPELMNILEQKAIVGETVILRRVMNPDGRTRAFINETIISASLLEEIAPYVVEICGQHHQYGLLNEKTHLGILDEYAQITDELTILSSQFAQFAAAKLELQRLYDMQSTAFDDQSYLEHMVKELKELAPTMGEEEELSERRRLLMNQVKLKEALEASLVHLSKGSNSALSALYSAHKALSKFQDPLAEIIVKVDSVAIELEEISVLSKAYLDKFNNMGDLEGVERRLFALKDLARKHNVHVDKLADVSIAMEEKLESLSHLAEKCKQKQAAVDSLYNIYLECAEIISAKRKAAALLLQSVILEQFAAIKMDKADFKINIRGKLEKDWDKSGVDAVNFLIKTNPGSSFCSIKEVASGGELSRIMLACKVAMAGSDNLSTLIFDEIDAGIGGAVSSSVGKKLYALAQTMQVLVVTHQPQVAAYSNHHYLVEKKHSHNNTHIEVRLLTNTEKIREVARMLAGETITDESLSAAKVLIKNAAA